MWGRHSPVRHRGRSDKQQEGIDLTCLLLLECLMLLEVCLVLLGVRGVREERLPAAAVGVRVLSSVAERRQSLEHSTNTELKHQLFFVFFLFSEATCAILRISSRLVFGLTSLATCPFLRGASSGQPHGRPSRPRTLSLSVPCLAYIFFSSYTTPDCYGHHSSSFMGLMGRYTVQTFKPALYCG